MAAPAGSLGRRGASPVWAPAVAEYAGHGLTLVPPAEGVARSKRPQKAVCPDR